MEAVKAPCIPSMASSFIQYVVEYDIPSGPRTINSWRGHNARVRLFPSGDELVYVLFVCSVFAFGQRWRFYGGGRYGCSRRNACVWLLF